MQVRWGIGFDYVLDVGLFVYGGQFDWWPAQCRSSIMAAVIRLYYEFQWFHVAKCIRMIIHRDTLSGRMCWESAMAYIKTLFWRSSWSTEGNTWEQTRVSILSRSCMAALTKALLCSKRASTGNLQFVLTLKLNVEISKWYEFEVDTGFECDKSAVPRDTVIDACVLFALVPFKCSEFLDISTLKMKTLLSTDQEMTSARNAMDVHAHHRGECPSCCRPSWKHSHSAPSLYTLLEMLMFSVFVQ